MDGILERMFRLKAHGTTPMREVVAGLTTFATMSYIIVVNPKILEAAGMPFGAAMTATILSAFFGSLAMGLYANRPFALAPYMGENAFIAFTVVKVLGYSWQTALGAVFVGGVLFTFFTLFGVRRWLIESIPRSLKLSFIVGIGLFLTFIGLNTVGLVTMGVPGAPVKFGNIADPSVLLAVAGVVLITVLMARRVPGALILGILIVSAAAYALGAAPLPDRLVGAPPSPGPVFLQLDIPGALTWGFFSVILTIFVMDFVDTMGSLYAVSFRGGLLDENDDLPNIERPLLVDALATVVGALLGTTTTGVYIESGTGIEAGGRTGLTAVTTALLFLLALFLAPLFVAVPHCAYGPCLIIVGMLMMRPFSEMEFDDLTEVLPTFLVVILMSFTYNLGIGMTAGFASYPIVKTLGGKGREVNAGMWVLCAVSVLFFAFYPH
ncbi:MAG: NCS2 family permease [Desulfovibrionaceae bacterium]|jgi:AGZA family xanthine/uracil permease-like MFS transporter|nr:NCS2 family permease [Desulfovibrionaceae bacterium]